MNLKKPLSAFLAALLVGGCAAVSVSALEPYGNDVSLRNGTWQNKSGYSFSDGYKKSVWYANFSVLELSGNTRNDILAIAISQLGYHEGEDGDYTGTNSSSAGNSVEYFRLIVPNWSNNSDEWCACFVNWCLSQAHVDYASGEIGCWKWATELKDMDMFEDSAAYGGTYTPQPADMIFFNWNQVNTTSGHIGYVLYTTDTEVYTIEGNADNNVTVRSYPLNDKRVIGYGTPPYAEGNVPTVDHSYRNGMPRGQYVVNASDVDLTEAIESTERICRIPLGARVTVIEEADGYAYVTYEGREGYIPSDDLYLLIASSEEDTLTYDANGGQNAPAAETAPFGESLTVSDGIPTLEGDTFLGWSLVPHNYRVDYEAGDTVVLKGDTTLYAVWEKRSFTLATEALSAGKVAEFDRPSTVENTAALRMGDSSITEFIDATGGNTALDLANDRDHAWGNVALSLTSMQQSNDPYITLQYAAFCEHLGLASTSADTVDYIILRVMDVSMYNLYLELFYDCGEGMEHSVSKLLKSTDDWQYVVLDMTAAEGFAGEIQALRIDWTKAADGAGNTMLLDSIYFAANEAQRDAVLEGKYIFPEQAAVQLPETEPETAPVTPPETSPLDDPETAPTSGTPDASDTASDSNAESDGDDSFEIIIESEADTDTDVSPFGCASLLGASGVTALVAWGGALLLVRKRED